MCDKQSNLVSRFDSDPTQRRPDISMASVDDYLTWLDDKAPRLSAILLALLGAEDRDHPDVDSLLRMATIVEICLFNRSERANRLQTSIGGVIKVQATATALLILGRLGLAVSERTVRRNMPTLGDALVGFCHRLVPRAGVCRPPPVLLVMDDFTCVLVSRAPPVPGTPSVSIKLLTAVLRRLVSPNIYDAG
jgi:hypothetical protein